MKAFPSLLVAVLCSQAYAVDIPNIERVTTSGLSNMYGGTIRAADMDGDGKVDLFMAGRFADRMDTSEIRIYRNISVAGSIEFQHHQTFDYSAGGLELGDYDNDGDIDFVSNGYLKTVGTNTNGTFAITETFPISGREMAVGDLTGDGLMEIVTARVGENDSGAPVPLYKQWNGAAWVDGPWDFPHEMCMGGMRIGDLNGDGRNDLLVGGNCGPFGSWDLPHNGIPNTDFWPPETWSQWHANNGNPLSPLDPNPAAIFSYFASGRDLSMDQVLETYEQLLVEGRYDEAVSWANNYNLADGMDNSSYALGDFDNDGNIDVAVAGSHSGFKGPPGTPDIDIQYDFLVLFNEDGTGKNFRVWEAYEGGAGNIAINGVTAGDFNGDGYDDAFFLGHYRGSGSTQPCSTRYCSLSRLYLSDPDTGGMVAVHSAILPQLVRGNGVLEDFDGDGRVDLIYQGAQRLWHYNEVADRQDDTNTAETIETVVFRNLDGNPGDTIPPAAPQGLMVN